MDREGCVIGTLEFNSSVIGGDFLIQTLNCYFM